MDIIQIIFNSVNSILMIVAIFVAIFVSKKNTNLQIKTFEDSIVKDYREKVDNIAKLLNKIELIATSSFDKIKIPKVELDLLDDNYKELNESVNRVAEKMDVLMQPNEGYNRVVEKIEKLEIKLEENGYKIGEKSSKRLNKIFNDFYKREQDREELITEINVLKRLVESNGLVCLDLHKENYILTEKIKELERNTDVSEFSEYMKNNPIEVK